MNHQATVAARDAARVSRGVAAVSQGGQYLAGWLARRGLGQPDHNVVFAISVCATVNALAVSGVAWMQPIYFGVSLMLGMTIFGSGVFLGAKQIIQTTGAPCGR